MQILFFQTSTSESVGIVWSTLNGIANSMLERLPFIVIATIVFTVFWVISKMIQKGLVTAGKRTRLDVTLARLLGRLISAIAIILGLLVAAVIVFPTFKPGDLVAGLGITSVAIGFAFKDVLQNFFAGILILWRRPFIIGDQIKVRDYEGTVEEINVRATRLKTYDGERAIIPNGDVYTSAVLVRTAYDKRRIKFVVGIGYLDDIEKGRRAIQSVLDGIEGVMTDPGPWIYVSELAPSSVNFAVYFWTGSQQANTLKVGNQVATGIKYALDKAGIDMPYPHNVVLFHDETGTRDGDIERQHYRSYTADGQST